MFGEFFGEVGSFGGGDAFDIQKGQESVQIEVGQKEQVGLDEGAHRVNRSEQHFQVQFVPICGCGNDLRPSANL